MIIAALRKAIAQLALGNLMQGWAAPETDLLSEAGLLPPDSHAAARTVNAYCLPPSLSSYEVAERALWHASGSLGANGDESEREPPRVLLNPTAGKIPSAESRILDHSERDKIGGGRN